MTASTLSTKRILITTDTIGGIWTYSIDLAQQLSRRGMDVALATMGNELSTDQWQQTKKIDRLRVYESTYRLEWMADPWKDVDEAGRWLLTLEKEFGPDVIHLNSYSFAALDFSAPVVVVCHSCVYSWWHAVKGYYPKEKEWQNYYTKVCEGLHAADHVVAVSHSFAKQVSAIYRIDLQDIEVIYNGLDPLEYQREPRDEFVFGMGRIWDESKNFVIADAFAPELDWPVRVAGETMSPEHTSQITLKNVVLAGQLSRDQVRKELSKASIFILPARYEPFGLSALEAAVSGCALVLADIPTLREIWNDAALFAAPDDPRQWEDALNLLIKNDSLRHQMVKLAGLQANRYNITSVGDHYSNLYSKLHQRSKVNPYRTPNSKDQLKQKIKPFYI